MTSKQWNDKIKIGTRVRYYPILPEKFFRIYSTRSEAWDISGTPCVLLEGKTGGVSLKHLEIIKES
jgi:hypothetical protein